jgi:hypothetical protein
VPDDQPQPSPPADPFAPGHSGNVFILENYYGLRRAGGRPFESALLVATYMVVSGMAIRENAPPGE